MKVKVIYFAILIVSLLLYIFTSIPAFLVVCAIMVIYALAALFVLMFCGRDQEIFIHCKKEAAKSELLEAEIELKNNSIYPVMRMDATVVLENLLTRGSFREKISLSCPPKRKVRKSMEIMDDRPGMLRISLENAVTSDPLRLFSKKTANADTSEEILVMPDLSYMDIAADEVYKYDMESFRYAEGRTGTDPGETAGIREYVPGDSIKAIHWKLTAKTGQTLIREFGYPIDAKLLLLSDKRGQDSGQTELTLSLSASLIRQSLPHVFGWYDEREKRFICEHISQTDDIYKIMPAFFRAPFSETQENAVIAFLNSENEKKYAGYLLVTGTESETEGLELLQEYADVTIFTPEGHQ